MYKWHCITLTASLASMLLVSPLLRAQSNLVATSKGPDQINLTWTASATPGYGYLVEIQSPSDPRYSSWTEVQPIPKASGYTCDPSAMFGGVTGCTVSDPTGAWVYNPPVNGIPTWVTEPQYIDPQDDTPAQFISWGLLSDTVYNYRVRTYTGNVTPAYGTYSNTASTRTAAYTLRYVSITGSDNNDGTAPDDHHAWRTLRFATLRLGCGQELIVLGGDYGTDSVYLWQSCTSSNKVVVMVAPGAVASITGWTPEVSVVAIWGSHAVIDGLTVAVSANSSQDYAWNIGGSYNALLNITSGPAIIPSARYGVALSGGHNLLYHSYVHDYGSPFVAQNFAGNDGFPLNVGSYSTVWSNHLTRGGHDTSLCFCSNSRWLNNVMDEIGRAHV
jgi:hypothetical protein